MARYLLAISVFFSATAFASVGNEGAHGGAGIYCWPSQLGLNEFNGFYMLDYILMRGMPGDRDLPYPPAFNRMTAAPQILDWIQMRLQKQLPGMAADLADFRTTVWQNNEGSPRRWFSVRNLQRVWDQGLNGRKPEEEGNFRSDWLPPNCRFRNIRQVVIKYPGDGYTAYAFGPGRVEWLRQTGPLQISYLIVHEWLRNYTTDAEVIRRINRLMHSTALEDWNQAKLCQTMVEIGLFQSVKMCN